MHLIREILWKGEDPAFVMIDGRILDLDALTDSVTSMTYRGLEGHLMQEWISPHPEIQDLTGGAPYSLRVLTAVLPDGEVEVQLAALRIGSAGAAVDAWSQGGLAAPVDPETGEIGNAARKIEFGREVVQTHPDTGAQLTGTLIPSWEEVKEAAIHMALITPGLRVVGWDVVVSSAGPRIIEGNFDWDLQLVQAGTSGLLETDVSSTWRDLGADLPDGSVAWRWRNRRRPLIAAVRRTLRRLDP